MDSFIKCLNSFFKNSLLGLSIPYYQALTKPPSIFPLWTSHEIWLKTKLNEISAILEHEKRFFQRKEICSEPESGFVNLKIIVCRDKYTQLCFWGWGIEKSCLGSQKIKGNTSFMLISVLLQHFQRDHSGQKSRT